MLVSVLVSIDVHISCNQVLNCVKLSLSSNTHSGVLCTHSHSLNAARSTSPSTLTLHRNSRGINTCCRGLPGESCAADGSVSNDIENRPLPGVS